MIAFKEQACAAKTPPVAVVARPTRISAITKGMGADPSFGDVVRPDLVPPKPHLLP